MKRPTAARICQLLFLAVFLVLFLMTEYRGSDRIVAAVNAFFRANPLTAVTTMLATKSYVPLLLPGLLMLFFAFFLGRFFCGWLCPLGTILDLLTARIQKTAPLRWLTGRVKYWLLLPLLGASLFNLNLAGLFDPIAILLRGLTFFLHPLLGDSVRGSWRALYGIIGEQRDLLAPGYRVVSGYLLPFREALYPLAFLSAAILLLVILLERYGARTWCRQLCPLGTLLGIAARFAPLLRTPAAPCSACRKCATVCPAGFDRDIMQKEECLACMACVAACPTKKVRFAFGLPAGEKPLMERRVFLGGLFSGFLLARLFRFRDPQAESRLLRPPGIRSEDEFLKKCVRCGECMKVCLKSALYPAFSQAGLEGLYTPLLIPRLGYCEYNCSLCGQVCPTGAIPDLPLAEKKRQVIGKAVFDKNHCIPFARRLDCIVCEEHCPIPQKAIRSEQVMMKGFDGREVSVKLPYVVDELCNGCGICEKVCPLEGKAAIEVFAVKDKTPLQESALVVDTSAPAAEDPYR
ncbi:MAG: 4Fe-4S ferredoxin iron-sulfur binding domain protein [Deltaproteobacteria bacterium]|nr:4Fe-4S ferredoxin iron-sulfur binding domain protein [Deltaproteobacteria bacterium]